MIVVTGGAGFIGSNLVNGLNRLGHDNIWVVDDLTDGTKFVNLADKQIADYSDKDDFISLIEMCDPRVDEIEVIFHQGACSDTTEWDGRFMMQNNFTYTCILHDFCLEREIPFIYASSAAVYGGNESFSIDPRNENPLNVYGYSKLLFDQVVRRTPAESQVAGLRYFNVYGPGEQHKGRMASVAYHWREQAKRGENVKLFGEYNGFGAGEQLRDFVYVEDVVAVNIWLWQNPQVSGVFNVGTGQATSYNELARAVLKHYPQTDLEYVPFPNELKGRYQSFTQADMTSLTEAGYTATFHNVNEGIDKYFSVETNEV